MDRMQSNFPAVCQSAFILFVICAACRVISSQEQASESRPFTDIGLPVDGEAQLFVSAFRETPCIAKISQRIGGNTNEIKYFICPKSLALVRLKLAFPLDKSRYTFLLRPVTRGEVAMEFQEITKGRLNQLGLDPEVLFRALLPVSAQAGMGATIGPILDVRIGKENIISFRNSLAEK